MNSPHKGPATRNVFPCDDVIMGMIFNPVQDWDPNDIYTNYHWSPVKTIHVMVQTPSSNERAPGLSRKHIEIEKNTNIRIRQNLELISVSPRGSWYTTFEDSNSKIGYRHAKNYLLIAKTPVSNRPQSQFALHCISLNYAANLLAYVLAS